MKARQRVESRGGKLIKDEDTQEDGFVTERLNQRKERQSAVGNRQKAERGRQKADGLSI